MKYENVIPALEPESRGGGLAVRLRRMDSRLRGNDKVSTFQAMERANNNS